MLQSFDKREPWGVVPLAPLCEAYDSNDYKKLVSTTNHYYDSNGFTYVVSGADKVSYSV